jgi:hypothetical protein
MLPAYPHVLRTFVDLARGLLSPLRADRILCTVDAIPFGVGLSLETNIPLVYSRAPEEYPGSVLVGAYDIGHPAILVTNVLGSFKPLSQTIDNALRVGLEVNCVLAIVNLGIASIPVDTKVVSLQRLPDLVANLALSDELPPDQKRAVLRWITEHSLEDEAVSG